MTVQGDENHAGWRGNLPALLLWVGLVTVSYANELFW